MYTIPAPVVLTRTLLEISALIRVLLSNTVSDLDLTEAQWRVISFINRGQGLTQTQLALLLGIERAPLGEQLDVLEHKQFLRREPDHHDKRVKRLYLTPTGASLAATLLQRFAEIRAHYVYGENADRVASMEQELVALSNLVTEVDTHAALSQLDMPNNLHLLGVLARRLATKVHAELAAHELTTTQWRILGQLLDQPFDQPHLKQKDLVRELNIAKAPLGKIITRLEQAGWLCREVCPQDRRAHTLFVTPQGQRRLRSFYADLAERLIPLDRFTAAKTEQLIADLRLLQAQLQQLQRS